MARHFLEPTFALPLLVLLPALKSARASEYRGQIVTSGAAVPGASVVATQAGKTLRVITDASGAYRFDDLPDGPWHIRVEMLGFAPKEADIVVAAKQPAATWELAMLPLAQALALTTAKTALPAIQASSAPTASSPAAKAGKQPVTAEAAKATGRRKGAAIRWASGQRQHKQRRDLEVFA